MIKISSIRKRWKSFQRLAHSCSNLSSHRDLFIDDAHGLDEVSAPNFSEKRSSSLVHPHHDHRVDEAPEGCKAVYVGKSRRRYFISAEYLNHPLLAILIVGKFRDGFSFDCEVVLFEHLVWILESCDPESIQRDCSLEEFAEFYSSN